MKLKDGGYLQFHHVDFGAGAAGFRAEVSSENAALKDAVLELRLDHPAGKLIGSIKVESTGEKNAYRIVSAPVSVAASGLHDLCLVARGKGGDPQGHLFNITWFAFTRH